MDKQLIDIAYDLAKVKYAKKAFTFKQLWNELIKKAKLDQQEQKQVGHVFTTMLQDHRFIFVGKDQWKIREFLTLEQQNELSNALYDFAKDNDVAKKTKEDEFDSTFDFDEEDEYKQHTSAALDDEEDEEDEIDNESESSDSDEDDEETKEDEE